MALVNPFALFGQSNGWHAGHRAVDYRTPQGTKFVSPATGIYRRRPSELRTDIPNQAGHYGDIILPNGDSIRVCHLDKHIAADGSAVKVGETIIGETGNTGTSSGPHMHTTGFRKNGTRWNWTLDASAIPAGGTSKPFPTNERKRDDMSVLLQGPDRLSPTKAILVVASPGVWDRYALGHLANLKSQHGNPVVVDLKTMKAKEEQYLTAFDVDINVPSPVAEVDYEKVAKEVREEFREDPLK